MVWGTDDAAQRFRATLVLFGNNLAAGKGCLLLLGLALGAIPFPASAQLVNVSSITVASSANPSQAGAPVTFTVTVAGLLRLPLPLIVPTGAVTFFDNGIAIGNGTLDGNGKATLTTSSLGAGSHPITVTYAGDMIYNPATSSALTQTVNPVSSSTAVAASVNPATFGASVTFTATVTGSGGTPTGTVTFRDGASTIGTGTLDGAGQAALSTASLAVGNHSITAVYAGAGNFAASVSSPLSFAVNQTTSSTAVISSDNPSAAGDPVTFTATVTGTGATPTGTVTFKDGATSLGSGSLNGSGVATLTTGTLALGGHSITAVYAGDGNFTGSTSATLTQTVNGNTSTTTLGSSQNPSAFGTAVTFTATVSGASALPTGSVTFKDGAGTIGSGSLDGAGKATLTIPALSGGSHAITASYGGDGNYSSSTSSVLTQSVNPTSSSTGVRRRRAILRCSARP